MQIAKGVGKRGDEAKVGSRGRGIVSLVMQSWWKRS